ncbi:DnaJ domain-containing protein [Leptolyngbya cf. ectocarpi LEGE 11479]|uniref:DnaJ domain-containing protein n=1 Tax=Leptolyngbya cf. ectocarpi LEGE 11479 TaxID=1828722 RepID=A0A928X1B2_LEPEC|nr:DnaJ domain-containing protein [Leptolyngbya ectocarpi]MBE9067164.1 DnaJ domain-containing protein [Leptolyngbya cf. ectocarpi LEGE 11479]
MVISNHYKTLDLHESASQADIKRAYHRLAKQYHPDSRANGHGDHARISEINAAYEVLGDPAARKRYDTQRDGGRAQRISDISTQYQQRRKANKNADDALTTWIRTVYNPIDRLIGKIISPLKTEVRSLSADPFDDELMEVFQNYLETCRELLEKAKQKFKSMPNPSQTARVAANLYYCLNQLEDGIEEIERFTYTYDDSYLHTGQELFRIAKQLRREAKADMQAIL